MNILNAIQSGKLRLICTCQIESEYLDNQFVLTQRDGKEIIPSPRSEEPSVPYIKSTIRDGSKKFFEEVQELSTHDTSPLYLIVDDIYLLGLTLQEITQSLRMLRCFVEDHFPVLPSISLHVEFLDYFVPSLRTRR